MRSGVESKGPFSGEIFKCATATLASLALALGGCSIGEAGAGASSSPEATTAPETTNYVHRGSSSNADCRENTKDGRSGRIADNQAAVDGEFGGRRMHNVLRRSIQD